MVHYRARHYAPQRGVFLSLDPVEGYFQQPMSLNGYSYVHGNPVNFTDPSGEFIPFSIPAVVGVAGLALAALAGYLLLQQGLKHLACALDPSACQIPTLLEKVCEGIEDVIAEAERQRNIDRWERELQRRPIPTVVRLPNPLPLPITQEPPTPVPTPTSVPCDPQRFRRWWARLGPPNPGGVHNAYEQRAAQGVGTMGDSRRVPTGGGESIDADGGDPNTCRLLEAKWANNTDTPPWRVGGFEPILTQADDAIRRYWGAVTLHPEVAGLEIRTNSPISQIYFISRLSAFGFTPLVNGYSTLFL